MHETTFNVSPEIPLGKPLPQLDHKEFLHGAFRKPIEAMWQPAHPLVACSENHGLIVAISTAFFGHYPLRLSPDAIWLTLARGFAIHVGLHAEELRHRFVRHEGKAKLVVMRPDFFPGQDNPWPEAFAAFSEQLAQHVGKLCNLIRCDFTTTGPVERAVSDLMAMDTFQPYFEYEMVAGCGIPKILLTGTVEDWKSVRDRAAMFGEFGLERWSRLLEPILSQFVAAAEGRAEPEFWQSLFRYHSGSGPSVMTGWSSVLFPYLKSRDDSLQRNPYLEDWRQRLEVDDGQHWRERAVNPQGVGMHAIPSCLASVPVKITWGDRETPMHFIGGLIGVSQDPETLTVQPECGWAIVYDDMPAAGVSDLAGRFKDDPELRDIGQTIYAERDDERQP